MAEQIVIAELQINTKALQDSNAKMIIDIARLKQEQKDLQKETNNLQNATEEQSLAFVENDAKLKQLNSEYANNKRVLAESATGMAGLNDALKAEISTVGDAEKSNKKLSIIRSQITTDTQAGRDAIDEINKKLDSNNDYIKENSDNLKKQKIDIGGYKEGIKAAFDEMNVFNGGIGGFIERSKEAGGTGNLLSNSFNGVKDGVIGMTKASLGFIATPVGAVIAAIAITLGILYSVFKSFNPVVDKAEQIMASFGAVVDVIKNSIIGLVTGTKSLTDVFSNLGGSMKDAASAAADLKKAEQDLEDQQDILEVQNAKASRQINELLLKSKDRTRSEEERIKFLQDAQKIEENIYNKNAKLAADELKLAQDKLIIGSGMTAKEISLLKEKGVEYARILQDKYALDDEDIANLKKALIKKETVLNDSVSIQEKAQNKVNALYEKADAEREKANEKAIADNEKAIQKRKERQDREIQMMNDELSLYIATENLKNKSTLDQIDFIFQISQRRLAILEKEYAQGKVSKAKYEEEILKISNDSATAQSDRFIAKAKSELDLFIAQNVTKLDNTKLLNQDLINEENLRLEAIKAQKLVLLAEDKKTNQELIDAKIANGVELSNSDREYLTEKLNLENEFRITSKANQDAFNEQVKQQRAEQLIADREIALAAAQTQFEFDTLIAQQQYDAEILALEERLKKESITKEQYRTLEIQANKKKDEMIFASQLRQTQGTLAGLQQLGGGMESLFGKSKALALAMAAINGAQAITSILAQYPKFDGGFAMGAAIVTAGVTTAAQIAEITSKKFKDGAIDIVGPGTGTSDSIPAMISNGESVIKASATAKYKPLLSAINEDSVDKVFSEFNNQNSTGLDSSFQNNVFANSFFSTQQNSGAGNLNLDYDLLASKIGTQVGNANMNLPVPILPLEDFNIANAKFINAVETANH